MTHAIQITQRVAVGEFADGGLQDGYTWEDHHREFVNPILVTALLREAVPVLDHVNWSVLETREGYARTVLPLNQASTNQHGTHQAALIALAADYTGGTALSTLLKGVPVLGVHSQTSEDCAALWLVSIKISFKSPSTSDLVVTAVVPPAEVDGIRAKYASGQHNIVALEIGLENDGEPIGTATFSYYLKQANGLNPRSPQEQPNALVRHRMKASARLIAGLRATENSQPNGLYRDPFSPIAAGPHGALLAERFMAIAPPLREMVVARTRNVDDVLATLGTQGLEQLVLLGAGLDFRAFRMSTIPNSLRVFELDLPEMLTERAKVIKALTNLPSLDRTTVALNLMCQDPGAALVDAGFDPALKSLVIVEGLSMYFDEVTNRRILRSVRELLRHPDSRVWIDVVGTEVVRGSVEHPEVGEFTRGMARLGEAFIFGLDDSAAFFQQLGYSVVSETPSGHYSDSASDPLFLLYRFYLIRSAGSGAHESPN